jgi:hypothetical protein
MQSFFNMILTSFFEELKRNAVILYIGTSAAFIIMESINIGSEVIQK